MPTKNLKCRLLCQEIIHALCERKHGSVNASTLIETLWSCSVCFSCHYFSACRECQFKACCWITNCVLNSIMWLIRPSTARLNSATFAPLFCLWFLLSYLWHCHLCTIDSSPRPRRLQWHLLLLLLLQRCPVWWKMLFLMTEMILRSSQIPPLWAIHPLLMQNLRCQNYPSN